MSSRQRRSRKVTEPLSTEEADKIRGAYSVFEAGLGAVVLDDLCESYYDQDIPPGPDADFRIGQRSVVRQILQILEDLRGERKGTVK